jgi:sulfur carrier protein ThiS adenylyltransferase
MTPHIFYELKNAVVGIAGLGGLGSNVATALTRLRIGKLVLADFDIVEESNLTRQQYFHDQIGMAKTEASVINLKRINPKADIVAHTIRLTPERILEIFAEANVIAECFDRPEQKQMLVETVLTKMKKTRIVSVSGLAGLGKSNEIRTRRISERHILVGDGENGARPGVPLTATRVGIAAYHQANAVAEVIVNEMHNLKRRS